MGFKLKPEGILKKTSGGTGIPWSKDDPMNFAGSDSDALDIFGLGLDAKRDIRGFLGLEAQDAINEAMGKYKGYVGKGIKGINVGYDRAEQALMPFLQGASAGGYNQNISDLLSGYGTRALIDEQSSAMGKHLGSVGLSRSGYGMDKMGRIPIDIAMNIENMLSGRQFQGGTSMGNLATERAVNISDLLAGLGAAEVGAAGAAGQARAQALGNVADIGGSVLGGMFCDERLKKNKRKIGKLGDIDIYKYEPNEEGERVGMNTRFGPMAQEVQEKYPDLVTEVKGYLMVDMDGLIERVA